MSIQSEIIRIKSNISAAYAAVVEMGGTLPDVQNSDNLEEAIRSIPTPPKIYGAVWSGSSTTKLSRTDSAAGFTDPVPAIGTGSGSSPFDNLFPWSGMTRVTDAQAGELVRIPKFWYKLTQSGNELTIQIADGPVLGFSVSPAHMDRGDGKGERDEVFIGRYHCSASNWKSVTGAAPKTYITRSAARTGIAALGTGIHQMDFAMRFTIWLLYIVEFADWDSQTCIGYGCGNNSAAQNMGYTDSMTYHTGTTQSSRTTYGLGTQYRWIEGLWDNVFDWMDGCYNNSVGMNIILNPASFSDTANGTYVGSQRTGWITRFTVSDAAGFPVLYADGFNSGSATTFVTDVWNALTTNPCLYCGGGYQQGFDFGLFYINCTGTTYDSLKNGCRLQKLP